MLFHSFLHKWPTRLFCLLNLCWLCSIQRMCHAPMESIYKPYFILWKKKKSYRSYWKMYITDQDKTVTEEELMSKIWKKRDHSLRHTNVIQRLFLVMTKHRFIGSMAWPILSAELEKSRQSLVSNLVCVVWSIWVEKIFN